MSDSSILGISLTLIGIYNFYSLFQQNLLFIYNEIIYSIILLAGIIFLFKAFKGKKNQIKLLEQQKAVLDQQKQYELRMQYQQQIRNQIQLIECDLDSQKIKNLEFLFKDIRVVKILKIKNRKLKQIFKNEQSKFIESNYQINGNAGVGNTNYLFHGTEKLCNQDCCLDFNCAQCNIILNGLKVKFSGTGLSSFQRFGKGIYFSNSAKKAGAYASSLQGQVREILLCKVIMGKTYTPVVSEDYDNEFSIDKYDSIQINPNVNIDLKLPEICVYKDERCQPKYIIYYQNI